MNFFIHKFSTRRLKQDAWKTVKDHGTYLEYNHNFEHPLAPPPFFKGQPGRGSVPVFGYGPLHQNHGVYASNFSLELWSQHLMFEHLQEWLEYITSTTVSFIIIVHLFTLSRVKNKHVLYPSESIEILLSCHSFESYAAMHRINMLLFHFEVWGFKWRKKERRGCHSKSFGRSCRGRDEDIEDPKVSQVIEVVWKGTQCHCKLQASKVFSVKSIILGSHHT